MRQMIDHAPAGPAPLLRIEKMQRADLPEVLRIERAAFSTTWPENAFAQELQENRLALYRVARCRGRIVGFGGIWVITEDSHVTTIAVDPDFQRRGFGEAILLVLLETAVQAKATWISLEVRVGNTGAQRLYRKYGFAVIATRKAYYHDNQEDALVMWAGNLQSGFFARRLAALRERIVAAGLI